MTGHLLMDNMPVYNLQVFLRAVSSRYPQIPSVLPDGYYGKATVNAVTSFQQMYSLTPTGKTDRTTWNAVAEEYKIIENENTYKRLSVFPSEGLCETYSSFAPTISIIQIMLNALSGVFYNLLPVEITGVYDSATKDALQRVKTLSGLEANDEITSSLWNIISYLYNAYVSDDRVSNVTIK